jgi:hypothetical protein
MSYKKKKAIKILTFLKIENKTVFIGPLRKDVKKHYSNFEINNYRTSNKKNKLANFEKKTQLSSLRPMGHWFETHFGNIVVKHMSMWGLMAISKNDIQQHPKSRYQKILSELEKGSNPEVGHYVERSWGAIFHPMSNIHFENYNPIDEPLYFSSLCVVVLFLLGSIAIKVVGVGGFKKNKSLN